MHRWTLALLTAGLLAATATGCADDTAAVPGAALPGTAVPGAADAGPRRATGDSRETLALAEQLLIKECMEKQGHEYWVEPSRPDDVSTRFPYAVDDPAWAEAHGYGTDLRRDREAEVRRNPNQRYFHSMSAKDRAVLVSALNGARPQGLSARLPGGMQVSHSDQGCQATADRKLYTDLQAWFRATRVTDSLAAMRVGLVTDDKRYKAAVEPWARCMRDRGYGYPGPAEARAAATQPADPWPHAKEVRLASAEAACAASSGLSTVAKSLDTEYRDKLRRRYPQETADLARLKREALPRARAIVARGD
ncbi:hypothetical protein ACOT81_42770 [Streptomyces sp. WI04-05B]|uniref:hypothetical protein n=1 Tax=Streptomyces TaxID=1883 RepID=UPI0029A2B635|nr:MULTISPECIES: hypothetical protein [unclassified Streptomyces]MDX2548165.1 hypothetical protein [Streptomyces sp. WI04-05B]MDX2583159.1 hypothetical protein [Streptomyces sp. WI04-05A]